MTRIMAAPAFTEPKPPASRIFNFSPGPATLPEEVLLQAREDIWSIFDSGIGIMEHSHRGKAFDRVIDEAVADCRALAGIGDDYDVLFLQGGATLQFAMIPMNFLPAGRTADYLVTGEWASKAAKEAQKLGNVHVAFTSESTGFDHTPADSEIRFSDNPAFVHYCSNNTIYGTRYNRPPGAAAPLIVDTSSEMFSRPIDVTRHALIYAGAQKNLGPSGVVLVIIRKDFMNGAKKGLPSILSYPDVAAQGSRLNTPPTFGIYFMGQVFKWILRQGGLGAMEKRNNEKAALIYNAIDGSGGFYRCVSQPQCRSVMNVTFRTPSPELDEKFVQEAKKEDMDGLKGYRTVGGMRASIYNAFPRAGCELLARFMRDFARHNG
jgi:phosphoserine aminotransferase